MSLAGWFRIDADAACRNTHILSVHITTSISRITHQRAAAAAAAAATEACRFFCTTGFGKSKSERERDCASNTRTLPVTIHHRQTPSSRSREAVASKPTVRQIDRQITHNSHWYIIHCVSVFVARTMQTRVCYINRWSHAQEPSPSPHRHSCTKCNWTPQSWLNGRTAAHFMGKQCAQRPTELGTDARSSCGNALEMQIQMQMV